MAQFETKDEAYYQIECLISDIQTFMKTRYSSYDEEMVTNLCVKLEDKCGEIKKLYHEINYEMDE